MDLVGQPFVTFQFGETVAALPLAAVAEVLPLPRVFRPPGLPSTLAGFINLRGEAVPVIALAPLLGGEAREPSLYDHLVVLKDGVALLVERVLDAAARAAEAAPADEADSLNGCVEANLLLDGRLVPALSAQRLLMAEEKERLADLTARAQARIGEWDSLPA